MATQHTRTHLQASRSPAWLSAKQAALMVCRSWLVADAFGRQEGKQYVLSDNGGFVVQGVVHCDQPKCNLCTLEEGKIYNFSEFSLVENNISVGFRKQGMSVLDVSRCNNVIHLACPSDGFLRTPVDHVALEEIKGADSKYLIDVMGLVLAVGVSRPTKRGSHIVDCHIMNWRGANIRLMLWNDSATKLLNYHAKNPSNTICVFTYMDVRGLEGTSELFLSSTVATSVHIAETIPALESELQRYARNRSIRPPTRLSSFQREHDHSLTQMLYIGRANSHSITKESVSANCKVKIIGLRKGHPWFSYTCPISNCQKGVIKAGSVFWCNSCEEVYPYAIPSYRLPVDVTDGISTTTIVFLDALGETLLQQSVQDVLSELGANADPNVPPPNLLALCSDTKIIQLKSHTYMDHRTHESFACTAIIPPALNVKLGIITPPGLLATTTAKSHAFKADLDHTPSGTSTNSGNLKRKAPIGTDTPDGNPLKAKRVLVFSSDEE